MATSRRHADALPARGLRSTARSHVVRMAVVRAMVAPSLIAAASFGASTMLAAQTSSTSQTSQTSQSTLVAQSAQSGAATRRAAGEFEGTVTMRIAGSSGFDEVKYSTKNGRARMDIVNDADTSFTLREGDRVMTIDHAKQRYFEQSMSDAASSRAGGGRHLEVMATGRKEIIAGYECEHVIVTTATVNDDICLARGIGTFLMAVGPTSGNPPASTSPELRDLLAHGFPLRDQRVGGDLVLEVTKIDRKPLSDGMFRVPQGYAKLVLRTVSEAPRGTH